MSKLQRQRAVITLLLFILLSGVTRFTPGTFGNAPQASVAGVFTPSLDSETVPIVG